MNLIRIQKLTKKAIRKLPLPDQEVECEMCDSTYQFQSGFRAHVKRSHSGQFKWTQCTYLFEDTEKLKAHIDFLNAPTENSMSRKKCHMKANKKTC